MPGAFSLLLRSFDPPAHEKNCFGKNKESVPDGALLTNLSALYPFQRRERTFGDWQHTLPECLCLSTPSQKKGLCSEISAQSKSSCTQTSFPKEMVINSHFTKAHSACRTEVFAPLLAAVPQTAQSKRCSHH